MIATPATAAPDPAAQEPTSYPPLKYRTILLFGAPGTGKGTMGKSMGAIPGFVHCACGDVFRTLDYSSPLGRVFAEYSSKGLLVPDDTTIALWKQSIDGLVTLRRFIPDRDLLVLDGIPRDVNQARVMEQYIDVKRIFHLECPDRQVMAERMRRRALKDNRLDDASDEVIARRWEVYEAETRPVLGYYPEGIIERVNALRSPVEVLHDILARLIERPIA